MTPRDGVPTAEGDERCLTESPSGIYTCDRPDGHNGLHAAVPSDPSAPVVWDDRWTDDEGEDNDDVAEWGEW